MLRLVWRNLRKHPIRSLLTVASLTVALFLLCFLTSVVTTLDAGVEAADSRRLWVRSAVSLFVDLPPSYESKIRTVEGVADVCKWQWFGGYYKERSNFFAQFAVEPEALFRMWPEVKIVAGSREEFLRQRTGCLIGRDLADTYGFEVGDRVPIIGALFAKPDGSAWDFQVAAIYEPTKATLDSRTFFFQWDYFEKTLEGIDDLTPNVGVFVVRVADGAEPTEVMARIDALFVNGPQRVRTATEAEFNRQFVSMIGNLPRLILFIGLGVFLAILLACLNTMLMAAREQVHDIGIMKALGFSDGRMFGFLIAQAVVLCAVGGAAGIALALGTESGIAKSLGAFFPGYSVPPEVVAGAVAATAFTGLVAGLMPAWRARRLTAVAALRGEA